VECRILPEESDLNEENELNDLKEENEENDLSAVADPSVASPGVTDLREGNLVANHAAKILVDHGMSPGASPGINPQGQARLEARELDKVVVSLRKVVGNRREDNPEVVVVRTRERAISNEINSAIREETTPGREEVITLTGQEAQMPKKEAPKAATRSAIPNEEIPDDGEMTEVAMAAETLIKKVQTMTAAIQTPEISNENFYCVVPRRHFSMGM
jgi:hypothetical protein